MALSSQAIDALIITGFEIFKLLSKAAKNEKITDEDLKLESWNETMKKVKEDINKG